MKTAYIKMLTEENKAYSGEEDICLWYEWWCSFNYSITWELYYCSSILSRIAIAGGLQRDVIYLGWPIAPSYMSPMGGGGVAESQPMSTAVRGRSTKLWRSNSIFDLWAIVSTNDTETIYCLYLGPHPPSWQPAMDMCVNMGQQCSCSLQQFPLCSSPQKPHLLAKGFQSVL